MGFEPETRKHVLTNGLTVLLTEIPSSPMVALYACVKTGSATEGPYLGSGISHFIEHMLFKGTSKRSVGEISREIKKLGGEINASTGLDYTLYTLEAPAGSFEKALEIMADMLMDAQFQPEEVAKEKEVILAEMKLHNDNPDWRLHELVFENVFLRHPYRHPIIGYKPLFESIHRENLLDYYHATYIPNNIIISIAGGIHHDPALKKIEEAFKNFKPSPYLLRNLPPEPPQITPRHAEGEYPTDLTRMVLAYQGVGILDRDMVPLDVLAMVLGQGQSSRLYLEIYKKKGLVHSIAAGNYTPMDKGVFSIKCLLEEQNASQAVEAIKEQIALIQRRGISPEELEKAKRQVLSDQVFGTQTARGIAYQSAIDEAFVGDPDFSKKYVKEINRVTSRDIQRVAQNYLIDENSTLAILKPPEKSPEPLRESLPQASQEIDKMTLENGLVVLVREDHSFPIIALNVAFNGGTRFETESTNGLSKLTSGLWIKGTQTQSAKEIAQKVESWGGSLNSFSGRNSLGLTLNILSGDLEKGLNLVEDLIKNPSFDQQEFLKSKDLMKAAIRQRDDDIFQVTSLALRKTLFLTHPFRLEDLGTQESLQEINREDVVSFYRHQGVPNNMVLAIFGDFKKDQLLTLIKKRFSSLKSQGVISKTHREDPPTKMREKTISRDKEQALVMMGFQGPILSDQDRFGMEVIASLLGAPLNGRLFLKIREALGKSYTLGGGYLPGPDMGFVYFYAALSEEDVPRVKELLIDEIKALKINDLSDAELAATKAYLKGEFLRSHQTNADLSFTSSLDELYGLGYNDYKRYPLSIERVSKADVKRLAIEYLDPRKSAVVITLPEKTTGR